MSAHKTDTSTYKFNDSTFRVKDPKRSIEFYEKNFGMKFLNKITLDACFMTVHYIGFPQETNHSTNREGVLGLAHLHGSENDDNFKVANGNSDPGRGFGHIAFSVDNIEHVCAKLEADGVKFQKRLTDGRQKNIAFALDPDGYWIELIPLPEKRTEGTDPSTYRFNHSMVRVKDPEVSMNFYRSVLGMSLIKTLEFKEAKFNLYFLGYRHGEKSESDWVPSGREGLLELTWNYGTESDPEFKGYHNGNSEPYGWVHIGVSVDDLPEAVARFKDLQVPFEKELSNKNPANPSETDEVFRNWAVIKDPDGYWVKITQNVGIKKQFEF